MDFVLLILGIVGAILVLNSVVKAVRRWARRARSSTEPRPGQEPQGAQSDAKLQKVREAAAKLSQEHMWLNADVLEQDTLFKSTVSDSVGPRSTRASP